MGLSQFPVQSGTSVTKLRLRRTTNLTVNNVSNTDITWDTEDEDTGGLITVSSATITIPTGQGGIWAFTLRWIYTTGPTGRQFITPYGTGSMPALNAIRFPAYSAGEDTFALSWVLPLADADTVKINIFNGTGSNLTLSSAHLYMYRLGA